MFLKFGTSHICQSYYNNHVDSILILNMYFISSLILLTYAWQSTMLRSYTNFLKSKKLLSFETFIKLRILSSLWYDMF